MAGLPLLFTVAKYIRLPALAFSATLHSYCSCCHSPSKQIFYRHSFNDSIFDKASAILFSS
jgi:hypothetical protein